ncbi:MULTISPECIES: glycosyltransferase family 2 protein [Planktothrix]|uniref:Glycosyl transferase n=2 Tax=Planktothrix TaxID=54304 RepID=A0A4P5ZGL0_PLAAG|nr:MULTISPECIES: glycosyltransferase family 2 protein [Planktothrix]GDZ94224.1 glycosyl transferase [Planktothrix agardhii CCAP 1459/11A]CAC5342174.1 Predicted glycosyltransferase [Planktothrix rubescens NIVA-CYA 18]CAD5925403.1 putative glycosyltransferase [Planktothrix rubescens NIVA-CYA 18]
MIYWITVNYYSTELIKRLINSLVETCHGASLQGINYQIIIINNSPDDLSIHRLKSPYILVFDAPENIGFGRACNIGLNWVYQQDSQALVWLINPDAYLSKNVLSQAIDVFKSYPELSILGTVIYNNKGELEFTEGQFNRKTGIIKVCNQLSEFLQNQPYQLTEWVSGCSLLINLKNFKECPQFDPNYFLYYEDFDFCLRYRNQGHKIGITAQIQVFHQTSSITQRNPNLKLQYSIYSYLLSLDKHTSKAVLLYWLFRISFIGLITILITPKKSWYKLKGVINFIVKNISNKLL